MAQFTDQEKLLPRTVLRDLKYEVANEIGVAPIVEKRGWGGTSSRDCGRVGGKMGGNMVKVLVRQAEEALMNKK
ncbi:alpha/beta-type small acid-soluble spore protein [Peptococcaceae bacterium 1198_IL3148]